MSKKIQLSIAEPCHENWEVMSPVEKGKFCGSCQKQVVDFSNMSDRQVAEFFKKPSTGSVCGRFMSDQLERDIEIPRKRIPFVKQFFQIALPAFLISAKTSAQTQKPLKAKLSISDTTRVAVENLRTLGMVMPKIIIPVEPVPNNIKGEITISNFIKGKVIDEVGQPVQFASIETSVPGRGIVADSNGLFQFDESLLSVDKKIFISSVGFETTEVLVTKDYLSGKELYIRLTTKLMEPVALKCYNTVRMGKFVMGGVSSFSRVQKIEITEVIKPLAPTNQTALKVFPNPVSSGSNFNISIIEMEEGYYNFQLINLSGQIVNQSKVWIDKEASILNFNIPAIAAGNYFVVLVNNQSGKKLTEKIIIQ